VDRETTRILQKRVMMKFLVMSVLQTTVDIFPHQAS